MPFRKLNLVALLVSAALASSAMPSLARAQASVGIEGVWQITKPQSMLTPADGKPLPFTKAGKRGYEANRSAAAKGDFSFDNTMMTCGSPGQPRLMLTSRPFAILPSSRVITLVYEWNRLFRQIFIGKPLISSAAGDNWWAFGFMQGHATGEWDGDTLVVRTDSFTDGRLLDAVIPASDQLTLVERIRLRDANTLEDRVTISDPANFTRKWEAVITYSRLPDSRLPFPEDVCFDRLRAGQPPIER